MKTAPSSPFRRISLGESRKHEQLIASVPTMPQSTLHRLIDALSTVFVENIQRESPARPDTAEATR